MSSTTKRKITLKKLKALNTIWHPESTLVFKSQKERLVIGRYVNEELVQLDNTALELCDEWSFKYDESLVEAGTEEEGGESQEEGDGAEEAEEEAEEATEEATEEAEEATEEAEEATEEAEKAEKAEEATEEAEEVTEEGDETSKPPEKEEEKKSVKKTLVKETVKHESVSALHVSDEVGAIVKNAIDTLNTQLSQLRRQLSEKEENIQALTAERDDLTEKHTKLQAKFDGIKQLFA